MAKRLPELRQWLKTRGMTQTSLARSLKIDPGQMSKIFRGLDDMSFNHAFKVAVLTGIPVEHLVTGGEAKRVLELYGERLRSGVENAQ